VQRLQLRDLVLEQCKPDVAGARTRECGVIGAELGDCREEDEVEAEGEGA
jgi:hypothetical protein